MPLKYFYKLTTIITLLLHPICGGSCQVIVLYLFTEELFDMAVTLQLVGGYKEESGKGGLLSKRILTFFAENKMNFKVRTNQVCSFWSRDPMLTNEIAPLVKYAAFLLA